LHLIDNNPNGIELYFFRHYCFFQLLLNPSLRRVRHSSAPCEGVLRTARDAARGARHGPREVCGVG
jgi:hypothetical protein